MQTARRRTRTVSAGLGLLLCAGCLLGEVEVASVRIVPGTLPLPGVSHLILDHFTGPGGADVAQAIAAKVLARRSFAVTDLTSSASFVPLYAEPALALHDERAALGLDAGIMGSVVRHELQETVAHAEQTDADGQLWTNYTRRGQLFLSVAFRAVDPATGTLFDARTLKLVQEVPAQSVRLEGPAYGEGGAVPPHFPPRDTGSLFANAYDALAEQFCEAVQVQEEPVTVVIYHADGEKQLAPAYEAVQRGDWDRALSIYRVAVARAEAHVAQARPEERAMAHFNVGVAYAHSGALARGLQELMWSQSIANTPTVQREIDKVQGWIWQARQPVP